MKERLRERERDRERETETCVWRCFKSNIARHIAGAKESWCWGLVSCAHLLISFIISNIGFVVVVDVCMNILY